MESLKIDRTKLVKVSNYADSKGVTRQAIYEQVKRGDVKIVEIDGVKFVNIP